MREQLIVRVQIPAARVRESNPQALALILAAEGEPTLELNFDRLAGEMLGKEVCAVSIVTEPNSCKSIVRQNRRNFLIVVILFLAGRKCGVEYFGKSSLHVVLPNCQVPNLGDNAGSFSNALEPSTP